MLEHLQAFEFPKNESRKNIKNNADEVYRGMALGEVLLIPYWQKIKGTRTMLCQKLRTKRYKDIFDKTNEYFKNNSPEPDFKYTTIQYNKNHKCAKHKDKNNVGDSYIIGFGDYTGGELIVYDDDGNKQIVDIKNKFFKFNGSKYFHETNDFTGERYTLVFFNVILPD